MQKFSLWVAAGVCGLLLVPGIAAASTPPNVAGCAAYNPGPALPVPGVPASPNSCSFVMPANISGGGWLASGLQWSVSVALPAPCQPTQTPPCYGTPTTVTGSGVGHDNLTDPNALVTITVVDGVISAGAAA